MKRIRLSSANVGKIELNAISNFFQPDTYLGMGQDVVFFENELAKYLGIKNSQVIVVNSGTAALHLACASACPIDSEIIVPSLTYVASVQAISAARCKPIFCDVHIESATLDLKHAKTLITPNTSAIMPMHYAGNPHALKEIHNFAAEHNLRVIEDAAHAFGSTFDGCKVGSFGDIVCFSFDGIKNITCAEGGAIIAFDSQIAEHCRQMRALGIIKHGSDFDVKVQGFRYHMSNIFAAIGRAQLARFDTDFAKYRKELLAYYYHKLKKLEDCGKIFFIKTDVRAQIIPHIFAVRILNGQRDNLQKALTTFNIETAIHYKPNHLLSFYKSNIYLPNTEQLYSELLSLPLHTQIEQDDINIICAHIYNFFGILQ